MKKAFLIVLSVAIIFSSSATVKAEETVSIDNAEKKLTTAYCMGTITASGQPVRYGICAGEGWRVKEGNWVACMWTRDGEFLGYFEILDTGGTDAIKTGKVLDVYFPTYDECVEWMKKTEGKCLVQYVQAEG